MNWEFLDTAAGLIAGLLAGATIAFIVAALLPPLVSSAILTIGGFISMMVLLSS